jgi:transcriptional regulator with XRE-family HTH domain
VSKTTKERPAWAAFGPLLRRWRDSAHITQEELADQLGFSATYAGKLEQGTRRPSMELVVHIAVLLRGDLNEGLVAAAYPPIAPPVMAEFRDTLTMMNSWSTDKLRTAIAILKALDEESKSSPLSPPASDQAVD